MKLRRIAARATALTATAVVVATGFTTTAWAGAATITTGSLVLNNGAHTLAGSGSGPYAPQVPVTVKLTRHGSSASQDVLTATGSSTSASSFTASVQYANANPGVYDVETHEGVDTSTPVVDSCSSCVTVIGFKPVVTSVAPATLGEGTFGGGYQNFVITGQNFTKGLYVQCTTLPCAGNGPWVRVLQTGTSTPDPNVSLTQTVNPSNGTSAPTATTPTTITLRVNVTGSDSTSYADDVEVISSDGPPAKSGACTACLTIVPRPVISSVALVPVDFPAATLSPASQIGQNAQDQTLVVTGTHFPSNASVFFEKPVGTPSNDTSTITVGHVAYADNGTDPDTLTLTGVDAAVQATGTWFVHVLDNDAHSASAGSALLVNPMPTASDLTYLDSSTSAYGQGAKDVRVDVTGPHGTYVPGATTTPHTLVRFSGPTGLTFTSQVTTTGPGNSPDKIRATFSLPENAATGDYDVTVINPDGGTSAVCDNSTFIPPVSNSCILTVAAGPKVSSASPSTVAPGFNNSVTITGTGFRTTANGVHVRIGPAGSPFFDGNGTATGTSTNSVTVSGVNVPANTTPADFDVVVTNNDDKGVGTGAGIFHVTNIVVSGISPVGESNDPGSSPVDTIVSGNNFGSGATVKLSKAGAVDIAGSATPSTTDTSSSLYRTFNISNVAPGDYDVVVSQTGPNPGTATCGGCFTVLANPPTISNVSPNQLGQGATDIAITVTGTNIFPGATLTFSNAKIHLVGDADVTEPGSLVQHVSVDKDATTGAGTVRVVNTDGQQSGTSPFTVSAGPKISSISPAQSAEGGTIQDFEVDGTGFQNGAVLGFSDAGVTADNVVVTATKITADVTIADDVAQAGSTPVHVTVANPDHGSATSPTDLTVVPAPDIDHLDPAKAPTGTSFTLHVIGDYFSSNATLTSDDNKIALSNVTVVNEHEIDATADTTGAGFGNHALTVDNQDGGFDTANLVVFTKPSKPSHLKIASHDGALTISWGVPASNGGDHVISYTATVTKHTGGTATSYTTASPSQRSHRFGGLTNGALYDVKVVATNAAGNSNPATGSGRPKYFTSLTLKRSATSVHQGDKVTLSGKLTRSTGGVVGAHIVILRIVNGHAHTLATKTTGAGGAWHVTFKPSSTASYRAKYAGNTSNRAATSHTKGITVKP